MEIIALVVFLAWFAGTIGYARLHFSRERPLLEPGNKHNQLGAHKCSDKKCYARTKDGYTSEKACIAGGLLIGAAWPFWLPVIVTGKGLRTSVTAGQPGLKAERAEVKRKDMLALAASVTPETIAKAELEAVKAEEDLQRARGLGGEDHVYSGVPTSPTPRRPPSRYTSSRKERNR